MTRLVIEREALVHNYQEICRVTGVPVIPVLKADGYGLGAAAVLDILREAGAQLFAVSRLEEALPLCETGAGLLLLSCEHAPDALAQIVEHDLICGVDSLEQARALDALAGTAEKTVAVHIKVDTGFGRFGFLPEEEADIRQVFALENLRVEGIFSHFSNAFAKDDRDVSRQYGAFTALCQRLEADGLHCGMRHMANSCAALRWDQYRLDGVRVGSALLGRLPVAVPAELKRVGVFESTIADIRTLPKGANVGYGNAFRLKRETRVAVLCTGSADGVLVKKEADAFRFRDVLRYGVQDLRLLLRDPHMTVQVNGQTTRVVGRVALTHTMVDVTNIDCHPGDKVVLPVSPIYVSQRVHREYC